MLAQNSAAASEQAENFPPVAKKFAPRILVVDDDRLVRWSVGEALGARGWVVLEAADGRSAMQEFGDGKALDLVLLDVRLPDSDDLRVLMRMRQKAPAVPVILMTAFTTREIVEEAQALRTSVISKPFDLDDLAQAADHALSSRVY
jgi:DNA-binding NtrC family response regulator